MVRLPTAREMFLQAIKNFPRWMSVRKRPEKATLGLYLASVMEEQEYIVEELKKFIKEFFLISYDGIESQIADYVYIIQSGYIDVQNTKIVSPNLPLTDDPKLFLNNIKDYCLYQDGYLIIHCDNVPANNSLVYEFMGYQYGGKLNKYHIWNIFDEFALFLGLERYTDIGETNTQLAQRCLLVFSRPTNSTRKGLQNTILNCLSNDIQLEREDIKIEVPDDNNVWLTESTYGTVYEKMLQLNHDVLRTKTWGSDTWEHNFKQLDYLSHIWDKEIEVSQDGVGQLGDLSVSLSEDAGELTDIDIQGYIYSEKSINEHCRKQRIRTTIPLQFIKYKNILNAHRIQYKITATPADSVDVDNIKLREEINTQGVFKCWLQDIVTIKGYYEIPEEAQLEKNSTYKLVFRSDGAYSDMLINKAELVEGYNTINLLEETNVFKFNGTTLKHKDVKLHATHVSQLKNYNNLMDTINGIQLTPNATVGTFTVNVTGCGGQTIKIESEGEMFDTVAQTDRWTLNGLSLDQTNHALISNTDAADSGTATLDINCMAYSFYLEANEDSTRQGTASFIVYIDGVANQSLSKTVMEPGIENKIEHKFDRLTNIKIVFTKSGEYSFSINDIKTTKYEITYSLTTGEIIENPTFYALPAIPDSVNNTLTVTVKNYDIASPVIKYIHIGPNTSRRNYTVQDFTVTEDNVYLNIDTTCLVSLYKIEDSNTTLITDNLVTKWRYTNSSDNEDIYLPIDISQFTEVTSSDKTINRTVVGGVTTAYILLLPGETLDSITVTGLIHRMISRRSIRDILNIDTTYNVYIARNAPGFLVKNPASGEVNYVTITKDLLNEGDLFIYENLPSTAVGVFYHDRPKNDIEYSNSTDRNFEDTFITVKNETAYIAYNTLDMYAPIVDRDLRINDTFYPRPEKNRLLFYSISEIQGTDNDIIVVFKRLHNGLTNYYCIDPQCRKQLESILFKIDNELDITSDLAAVNATYSLSLTNNEQLYTTIKERLTNGYWSLGDKELYVTNDFDFNNSNVYDLNINSSDEVFSLSNNIELPEKMKISGDIEEYLSAYIIKVPDHLEVVYSDIPGDCTEGDASNTILYPSEDGFHKLVFSNIIRDSIYVYFGSTPYTNYTVLYDEGIIIWNNIQEVLDKDQNFTVSYSYKIPTHIRFLNLSDLYEIVNYNIEAYLAVGDIIQKKDLADNAVILLEQITDSEGNIFFPDYVHVVCSNPNFLASYSNGQIFIKQVYKENTVLVQAGYYYDNFHEYYYFNHLTTDIVEWYQGVTLHNVKKLDTIFVMNMESANYILNTDFAETNNYFELCYVPFNEKQINSQGISQLNMLTACDTFNQWRTSNMDIAFTTGVNNLGLLFTPDNNVGYAILDITQYMVPDNLISFFQTNTLSIKIFKEIKVSKERQVLGEYVTEIDTLSNTVFAEPFADFTLDNNFMGYKVPQDLDKDYRYFLVVQGNGILDDFIVRDNVSISDQFGLHIKNIDEFGFVINEKETVGTQHSLAFDPDSCILEKVEIAKDNTIRTASTINYGLTRVFASNSEYDNVITSATVSKRKSAFITTDSSGHIKTPRIWINNYLNAVDIYVKINDLMIDNMMNFNVKVYQSAYAEREYTLIGERIKTNLAHFFYDNSAPYLEVQIDMSTNKVISSLEVYIRYAELGIVPLVIDNYTGGYLITKIYDMVTPASYQLQSITGEFDNLVTFQMRGCRQDNNSNVWTEWYDISITNPASNHIFDNYRLFQFKINLGTIESFINNEGQVVDREGNVLNNVPEITAKIQDFIMEVVSSASLS